MRRREGGHDVAILVWLCSKDHRFVHSHPEQARQDGYIISVSEQDPASVPIKTFMGWVRFDNEGDIQWAE